MLVRMSFNSTPSFGKAFRITIVAARTDFRAPNDSCIKPYAGAEYVAVYEGELDLDKQEFHLNWVIDGRAHVSDF